VLELRWQIAYNTIKQLLYSNLHLFIKPFKEVILENKKLIKKKGEIKLDKIDSWRNCDMNLLSITELSLTAIIVVSITSCTISPQNEGYELEDQGDIPKTLSGDLNSPDYSHKDNWALNGFEKCNRDLPKKYDLEEKSANGADVFYIYPTMYNDGGPWIDYWPIRHQTSVFNGVGRIFAPRYRQAHYRVFKTEDELGIEALDVAYSDVRKAFMYWLDNFDTGRPIIIAGHSQGTWHARLLLQEFFDGTELQERLVVAYLPGFGIYKDDFKTIKACKSSGDTNCYCAWMTYATGYTPDWLAQQEEVPECINPISWDTKTGPTDPSEHLGLVTDAYKFKYKGKLTTRVHRGMVWLDEPDVFGGGAIHQDNWHIGDYNLFWANIRMNVSERLGNFSSRLN